MRYNNNKYTYIVLKMIFDFNNSISIYFSLSLVILNVMKYKEIANLGKSIIYIILCTITFCYVIKNTLNLNIKITRILFDIEVFPRFPTNDLQCYLLRPNNT